MLPTYDPSSGSPRLLLVEDHDDSLRLLSKLLGLNGYGVVPARTAAEALDAAAAQPPDLVICDLVLPDGCGLELLAELRRVTDGPRAQHRPGHFPRPSLQGIAVSGMADEATIRRCAAAGFARHLSKPVDFDELLHAVRAVLQGAPAVAQSDFDTGPYASL